MFPGGRGGFGGRGRGGYRGGRRSVSQFPVPPLPPGVNLPPIEPSAIKVVNEADIYLYHELGLYRRWHKKAD